ncbi:MAG: arginine--tRNA ligase, partial [Phycisphaerae bacterium]|nr:arginine--tRNA ligase [Phycisphaerae bacterium]
GFADEARETVVRLQSGAAEERAAWEKIVAETRNAYQPIYERLNVKLRKEHERGESFYNPFLPSLVAELKSKGIAVESQGATVVFVDGPEKPPMIIEKSGGGFLYATTDLAGIWYRVTKLGARRLIYTHDSRQADHFRQVFATARRAGWAPPEILLEYAPFGTVLGEDGKPFKTRSGDIVKLKDLLDEAEERGIAMARAKAAERESKLDEQQLRQIGRAIGIGAVKYADLAKDRISNYVFSWDQMLALDGNTAPYLQYAYARIRSIQRKAGSTTGAADAPIQLQAEPELALAKHILRLGEVIELVARDLKPHFLAGYLYDLATKFSQFYEGCPVLQSAEPTRSSRLQLCDATARTLALGLELLGIEHPEQM